MKTNPPGSHPDRTPDRKADVRESVRYAVSPSAQDARLKIGSTVCRVRLLEVSTRGFTVVAFNPLPHLRLADVCELYTNDGNFEVGVVNVAEVGPDQSTTQRNAVAVRLGLERLRELSPRGKRLPPGGKTWKPRGRRRWWPSRGTLAVAGSLFALAIVLVPVLVICDAQVPNHLLLRNVFSWGRHAVGLDSVPRPAADAAADASALEAQSAPARRLARNLPGPEPFAAPEVVRALQLTDQQQAKLNELIETTVRALREFDQHWQNESRQAHAKKRAMVLDAARQAALQILTEPQRRQWRELTE